MLVKRGDEVIARARGDWVYLNRAKLAPARIAPEIVDYFNRSGPPVLVESKRDYPLKGRQGREFAQTRRVQRYEMDSVAHVNNAVYLNWLEEAVADALERAGYHLLPGVEEKRPTLWFQRHTLEYLRPAFAGDEIEVKTALVGAGLSVGMWEQTIERGGELLVRNLARTRWVDADGRHARWQDTLVDALAL
jgi:acyl-CoA thioester hydrolase